MKKEKRITYFERKLERINKKIERDANKEERLYGPSLSLFPSSPRANASSIDYAKMLRVAVKNSSTYNIALMGGYCTGKSSILDNFTSWFHRNKRCFSKEQKPFLVKKVSLLNLGHVENDPKYEEDKDSGGKMNLSLQKEIVTQLYYGESPLKLNWSKFTRISQFKSWLLMFVLILVGILIRLNTFKPLFINPSYDFMQMLQPVIELGVIVIASYLLTSIVAKMKIKALGAEGINIQLADHEPDFDQLLDELIYFFKATKYDVVIFEDLDRFDNVQIYEDLRQLNYKLNQAKQIRQKITFIYALKDSLIEDVSERFKLFEQVIPVIPFMSPNNSKAYLVGRLKAFGVAIKSPELVSIISEKVCEMRQIDAFSNFAALHIRKIKTEPAQLDWLSEDEIIATALIRQLYPKEYEAMQTGTSRIDIIYAKCVQEKHERIKRTRANLADRVNIENRVHDIAPSVWRAVNNVAQRRIHNNTVPVLVDDQDQAITENRLGQTEFWEYLANGGRINDKNVYKRANEPSIIDVSNLDDDLSPKINRLLELLGRSVGYYKDEYLKQRDASAWNKIEVVCNEEDNNLTDILKKLANAAVLSDSFRACIAPYYGSQSSKKVLDFINNTVQHNLLDYDQHFTKEEIFEITQDFTKYDFDSIAFLNFSIVDAIIDGVLGIRLSDFLIIQKRNLTELVLFYDAYAQYCLTAADGESTKRLKHFTSALLETYPNDIIGHACITGLFEPGWSQYSDTVDIFLEVMAQPTTALTDSEKDYCLKNINALCRVSCGNAQKLLLNQGILVEDINEINSDYQQFKDYIITEGLFAINRQNLAGVQEASISKAMSIQTPTRENLKEILMNARGISKHNIQEIIKHGFSIEPSEDMKRALASAILSRKLQIDPERIILLLDAIEPQSAIRIALQSNLDKDALLEVILNMGEPYNRLSVPGKRPSLPNDKLHKKLISKMEEYGLIRVRSRQKDKVQVEVKSLPH